jgi:hypothetical protein
VLPGALATQPPTPSQAKQNPLFVNNTILNRTETLAAFGKKPQDLSNF